MEQSNGVAKNFELAEDENNFLAVTEACDVATVVIGHESREILFANSHVEPIFGLTATKLVGRNLSDFIPDEAGLERLAAFFARSNHGERETIHVSRDDGERVACLCQQREIILRGEKARLMTLRDHTEQEVLQARRAQVEKLEASFSQFLDSAPDAVISADGQGQIIMFNQGACDIFGYDRAEVLGKSIDLLMPSRFWASHERHMTNFKSGQGPSHAKLDRGGIVGLRKDGTEFPVEASVTRLNLGDEVLFNVILRDISNRLRLEEQVRRTSKLDAVGQLTAGVAHDFNNILGIVMGNLEILQLVAEDREDLQEYLEMALKGARRGAQITEKLFRISRKQADVITTVDVNDRISQIQSLISTSLTPFIDVKIRLGDDTWPVRIDGGDFEDVLLNLAINARDAMPDGGALTIKTTNQVFQAGYHPKLAAGGPREFVTISVSDTGCGMSRAVIEKIFEPFFTTKDVGRGTGLGLSMVYGFMERSEGFVEVESELDKGTTFHLHLPRAAGEEGDQGDETSNISALPRGHETILVVEDEEGLRNVAVIYLKELGYDVITAKNGSEALGILETRDDIGMLFSDLILPGGLSGQYLARMAHRFSSSLKVLLTTGLSSEDPEEIGSDDSEEIGSENHRQGSSSPNILPKPYALGDLALAVRETLDAP